MVPVKFQSSMPITASGKFPSHQKLCLLSCNSRSNYYKKIARGIFRSLIKFMGTIHHPPRHSTQALATCVRCVVPTSWIISHLPSVHKYPIYFLKSSSLTWSVISQLVFSSAERMVQMVEPSAERKLVLVRFTPEPVNQRGPSHIVPDLFHSVIISLPSPLSFYFPSYSWPTWEGVKVKYWVW